MWCSPVPGLRRGRPVLGYDEPPSGLQTLAPLPASDPDVELPGRYREWLEQVEILITDEERAYFLTLRDDFRRNAFIDAFWNQRDPDPDTPFNELRFEWDERIAAARLFESFRYRFEIPAAEGTAAPSPTRSYSERRTDPASGTSRRRCWGGSKKG